MPGRHSSPRTDRAAPVRAGSSALAGVAALLVSLTLIAPAHAARRTVNAQLSLTGLVDDDNPAGGSQIGIHPGDSVNFTASAVPTAKSRASRQLGLGGVLGACSGSVGFQVHGRLRPPPRRRQRTPCVTDKRRRAFTFATIGTYTFT